MTNSCFCCSVGQLYLILLQLHRLQPVKLLHPWDVPGKNTGVGCHFLLQGIFPSQGSNPWFLRLLRWQVCSLLLTPPGKPVPFAQFSLMITYCKIIAQYHNQEIEVGTIHSFCLDFPSFTCMCFVVCIFIPFIISFFKGQKPRHGLARCVQFRMSHEDGLHFFFLPCAVYQALIC